MILCEELVVIFNRTVKTFPIILLLIRSDAKNCRFLLDWVLEYLYFQAMAFGKLSERTILTPLNEVFSIITLNYIVDGFDQPSR